MASVIRYIFANLDEVKLSIFITFTYTTFAEFVTVLKIPMLGSYYCDKIPKKTNVVKQSLSWFRVLEVSVCGCFVLLLWACGGTVHHDKSIWLCGGGLFATW